MNLLHDNPFNPPLAAGVRRLGFRKWYERELLSSHAHMVLCVLAVIGLLGSLEAMRLASLAGKVMNVAAILACAAIAGWALRRYFFLLTRAEDIANQANCDACGTYGRFKVVGDTPGSTRVCCTRCAHQWTIRTED